MEILVPNCGNGCQDDFWQQKDAKIQLGIKFHLKIWYYAIFFENLGPFFKIQEISYEISKFWHILQVLVWKYMKLTTQTKKKGSL